MEINARQIANTSQKKLMVTRLRKNAPAHTSKSITPTLNSTSNYSSSKSSLIKKQILRFRYTVCLTDPDMPHTFLHACAVHRDQTPYDLYRNYRLPVKVLQ